MTDSNTKGVCHASSKAKGDCTACCQRCGGCKLCSAALSAKKRLIEAGIPETIADLCAWLSDPMFRHEYPDADPEFVIAEPTDSFDLAWQREIGFEYDVWIGMGYISAHSRSACKLHFDIDPNTGELTWCNVSEWAEGDDRWRGTALFYDMDHDQLTLQQLREEIDKFFAD